MKDDWHILHVLKQVQNRRSLKRIIAILSVIVLLVTINSLKLDADTLERIPACGIAEHAHTDVCFAADGSLICNLMEHAHSDACYQQRPKGSADAIEQAVEETQTVELSEVERPAMGVSAADDSSIAPAGIEAPAEELDTFVLDDGENEALNGAVDEAPDGDAADAIEAEAVEAEFVLGETEALSGYIVGSQYPFYLSDVIRAQGLALSIDDGVEIGQAIENDDDPILFTYEKVDEDIALYVNRDFERAELVISAAGELHVVELLFGIAPMKSAPAAIENEETVLEDEAVDVIEAPGEVIDGEAITDEAADVPMTVEEEDPERHLLRAFTHYAADVDLADVVAYPISLNDLMARAERVDAVELEPAAEPIPAAEEVLEVEEVLEDGESTLIEAPVEEVAYSLMDAETPIEIEETHVIEETQPVELIESEPIEPMLGEITVELGAETAEPEATDGWIIDYDAALLSIAKGEDGYALTVVGDFEETLLTVNNGDIYTLTLRNGAVVLNLPAARFTASTETMVVDVEAPEGAFPEGTRMVVTDVDDADTISNITDKVEEGFVRVKRVHAVDITFLNADGAEIEPLIPISVTMSAKEQEAEKETVVVHVNHDGEAQVLKETTQVISEQGETIESEGEAANMAYAFTADAFSVYALVVGEKLETRVMAADGNAYRIEVTYAADAEIPADARLAVAEVTDDAYMAQARENLESGKMITLARFFDIKIMSGEDEIQPATPVNVRVALVSEAERALDEVPCAVHFAGDAVEVVKAAEVDAAVSFRADSFSVWGVVYTVDFHYVVDGREFAFAIPGGGCVSFQTLAEVMRLAYEPEPTEEPEPQVDEPLEAEIEEESLSLDEAEAPLVVDEEAPAEELVQLTLNDIEISEATRRFVANVANIEFSSSELVAVCRADAPTTVGALKAAQGLECLYSAELTEAQIAEIDATMIEAGDWALISLVAFDSEETLTVTMKDGTSFEIRVTDAHSEDVLGLENETYIICGSYADNRRVVNDDILWDTHYYAMKNAHRDGYSLIDYSSFEATLPYNYQWTFEYYSALIGMTAEYYIKSGDKYLKLDGGTLSLVSDKASATTFKVEYDADKLEDTDTYEKGRYRISSGSSYLYFKYTQNSLNYSVSAIEGFDITSNGEQTAVWLSFKAPNKDVKKPATINTWDILSDGIILNLYDYDGKVGNNNVNIDSEWAGEYSESGWRSGWGINKNRTLLFTGSGRDSSNSTSYLNRFTGLWGQNNDKDPFAKKANQGIVEVKLNEAGYPVLAVPTGNNTYTIQSADVEDNRSLGYLFGGKANQDGLTKYEGANGNGLEGLLRRDSQGYYYYDSEQNYARLIGNEIFLYSDTYKKDKPTDGIERKEKIGFFPFNDYNIYMREEKTPNIQDGGGISDDPLNYYKHQFGLSMEAAFKYPLDGRLPSTGEPMIFEFSGDDDAWVFIDGVLLLDIGGVHQPVKGTINFHDKIVTVIEYEPHYDISTGQGVTYKTKTFDQIFEEAGKRFNSNPMSPHYINFYYLERGGCDSNLAIKFNLPMIPGKATFDVTKYEYKAGGTPDKKLEGVTFGIYSDPECRYLFKQATSDANGKVEFTRIPFDNDITTYYVREISAPEGYIRDTTIYKAVATGVSADGKTYTVELRKPDNTPLDTIAQEPYVTNEEKSQYMNITLNKSFQTYEGEPEEPPANAQATFKVKRYKRVSGSTTKELDSNYNGPSVTLPQNNSWSYEFTNLDAYTTTTSGNYWNSTTTTTYYEYFIEETSTQNIPTGYTAAYIDEDGDRHSAAGEVTLGDPGTYRVVNVAPKVPKFTVEKQWLNFAGNPMNHNGTLDLTLVQSTLTPVNVTVKFECTGNGSGGDSYTNTSIWNKSFSGTGDLTITWEWNQYTKDEDVTLNITDNKGRTYNVDECSECLGIPSERQQKRKVVFSDIREDLTITVVITNNKHDGTNSNLINKYSNGFSNTYDSCGKCVEVSRKTITLSAENDWKQLYMVEGSGLVRDITGTKVPAKYNNKTSYYSILEETVPTGYTSVVSQDYVTDEGTLLVTNTANWQTTELRIRKVRNDGLTPLADAVFQLSWKENEQGVYQVSALDGVEGLETVTIGGVTYDNTFTSTEMTWYLNGLRDGYYKLKEIHIPAGFTNTIGDIFFEIHNGVVSCPMAEQTDKVEFQMAGVAAAEALMTITNDVGGGIVLPATGGPGTAVFYAFGAALVLLAFAMIMRRHHPDF